MKILNSTGQLGKPLGISAVLGAALVLSGNSALASISYMTAAGAHDSNGSVDASASFTVGNGTVTVTLTDLLENPISSGQALSGVEFTVSGATSMATLASSSGVTSTITPGSGAYTPGVLTSPLDHWSANNGANLATVGIGGGKPYDLIVGPDSAGSITGAGTYSNANNGFSQFNPYVLGSATFTVDISGVTSNSTLSGVVFEFGTTPETVASVAVPTPYSPVPEPGVAGVLVGCLNLLPLGVCLARRLNNKQTPKS
jgi:hypothetical protein